MWNYIKYGTKWSFQLLFTIFFTSTLQVQLPTYIDNCREKLAENIHELWAMGKMEQGWIYHEVRGLGEARID